MRGRGRCSCRPGTRHSACRRPGTSSGRCGCSRCSPTRPTCSTTTTSSGAATSSKARPPSWSTRPRPRSASIDTQGGMLAAIDNGYVKSRLVESNAARVSAIEAGERPVVGVNRYTETERSPLGGSGHRILRVDPRAEREQIERVRAHRRRSATRASSPTLSPSCARRPRTAPTSWSRRSGQPGPV